MQREFLIETRSIEDENGLPIFLKYYLIEEDITQDSPSHYRISVRKSSSGETSHSTPITSHSQAFVQQLLQELIQSSIAPVCLLEIVDEMITNDELILND